MPHTAPGSLSPDSPSTNSRMLWPVARVRQTFIDFFAKQCDHRFVPSSPCVPHDDPTLLFANAGMNQFKPLFLGTAKPGTPLYGLKRAVNSQKCIRAGGKHNDLDDVGKDTYHHTFFEMLGNWSFGDYFKKEAVAWSWELLTKVYGLPPAALYATYFGGNKEAGLEPDLETKTLWEQFLPPERVLPGNMKDNFWEMGETGPCGPCTEIHVDRLTALGQFGDPFNGGGRDASKSVNSSDPDVIEIWNNVFIQFNREPDRSLKVLPAQHVDTGMGLERLTSILQSKRSNYDTDVFLPIFAAIEDLTKGRHQYRGRLGAQDKDHIDTAFRVIADHIRTLTFAVTDGAVPSNEGRGYVLRRILRRAVRYGRQTLGLEGIFFSKLVPVVVDRFGEFFPELKKNPQRVMDVLRDEEESFGKTLDRGLKLFDEAATKSRNAKSPSIGAEDAFKLHDTYGFPIDLTVLMAEERGMNVDVAGYEKLMEQAKDLARSGNTKFAAAAGGMHLQPDTLDKLEKQHIAKTNDIDKFHGRTISAMVKAIWNGHNFDERANATTSSLKPIGLVLDRTNFYAEMGGQEADHGRMIVTVESRGRSGDRHDGGEFRVEGVHSFGGYVLHVGRVIRGEVAVGDTVELHIDNARRSAVASNHTATHLLNLALKTTLGDGIDQKGSLVAQDKLRFDFSFGKAVAPEELAKIEAKVQHDVREDLTVYTDNAPLDLARNISGLRAVFGEQYPNPVRVVSVGVPVRELLDSPSNPAWTEASIEFCGGTHVETTKQINAFALVSEEAVAKGIRRITAITGVPALAAFKAADDLDTMLVNAGKATGPALASTVQDATSQLEQLTLPASRKFALREKLAQLVEKLKAEQKAQSAAKSGEAVARAKVIADDARKHNHPVIVTTIDAGGDRAALQAAVNTVAQTCPGSAVMLASVDMTEGKVSIMASVPAPLIAKGLKAGDWVRVASEAVGGKGGGKPEAAQGGGTDISKVKDAIAAATAHGRKIVGM
jgi:alanyl-tRNA synthetase